ncbi:hypothetical protein ALC57_08354 [Trachymyrmex cornetzi]|uniref:Uncharacterized protein n=1 Tax=Trachymyrmex cornetzi TaxID=471704 RepID=A0A151J700_9HYME|nr:hypothetical protein ALC57_08354 [Trachymyrmex cornetzi]
MGYRISTPINVMLAEAKEISFDIRLNLTTSRFIYKAMASRFSLVYRSLEEMELAVTSRNCRIDAISKSRLFKHYVTSRGEKSIIHRSTYPPAYWHSYEVLTLQINYISDLKGCDKKNNLSLTKADFYHKSFNYRQDAVSWYTDGSKSQGGAVGAAVFTPDMEDSESALEALSNSTKAHRNYIIYYIKQAYLNITKQDKEIFFWVPAHVGIPGNESADAAAKQAAIEGYKPPLKIPYEDLLTESTAQANRQSEESMKIVSSSKGTLYYENFYNASPNKVWFHGANLSRNEIVMINRLRSNHINVNESLHRVNMVESPACPCGDPRQSIDHLIFHCETFNSNSSPIRNYIAQKFPDPSPNLLPALRSPSPKLCRLLLAYMKANELFF